MEAGDEDVPPSRRRRRRKRARGHRSVSPEDERFIASWQLKRRRVHLRPGDKSPYTSVTAPVYPTSDTVHLGVEDILAEFEIPRWGYGKIGPRMRAWYIAQGWRPRDPSDLTVGDILDKNFGVDSHEDLEVLRILKKRLCPPPRPPRRLSKSQRLEEANKHHIISMATAFGSGNWTEVGDLTHIAQGDDVNQRIGNSIRIEQIFMRFTVSMNANLLESYWPTENIRIVIILDKQSNRDHPDRADIFEFQNVYSFQNMYNKRRFRVLLDRSYDLKGSAFYDGSSSKWFIPQVTKMDSWFHSCNIPVQYGGADQHPITNHLSIWANCRNGNGRITGRIKVRYSDH